MPRSIKEILEDYKQEVNSGSKGLNFSAYKNEMITEKRVKVPGIEKNAPTSAGKGYSNMDVVKQNLRSLGFDVDDLAKQKTIAQLMAAPFGFKFSLIWPEENEWGEKSFVTLSINGKPIEAERLDTRAKVSNPDSNGKLILETKLGPSIIFIDPKELERTLGGDAGKLPPGKKGEGYKRMLEEGVTYKVQVDSDVILSGEGNEEESTEKTEKEVPIPEEIASGKNRNEIFRLLLKGFGKYNGAVVYGDGFKDPEMAKEYSKLQREVQKGNASKDDLKEFREKSGRDSYSMMISNLRKSFPNNFLKNLSKAFPEFNIQFTKQNVEENYTLSEDEENKDKYKRWNLVFPGKVVGGQTLDNLDKNVREFMVAVKKWFAVPVKGPDGKKRSYSISYDEDKVNQYWNNFYGTKTESKLTLSNILMEMLKEEDDTNGGKTVKPDYLLLKILPGGLQTIDEGQEEVESRAQGGSKGGRKQLIDALLVEAAAFFKEGEDGKINQNDLNVLPGYSNDKTYSDKKGKSNLNIEYTKDGKVTKGVITIKNNTKLSNLLTEVIKDGDMKIKKSKSDGKYIILYYPSQTEVSNKINNTWGEILK